MIIKATNIKKCFDDLVLFDNFSIEMRSNEFIGLYGPSGSGKSTIMNILGLIEDYDSGTIEYNQEIIKYSSDKRKLLREEIGFVFQDYALISNQSVAYNFKFIKDPVCSIEESLKYVGLEYVSLNRKIFTLSGGEQQRLAIAKVIYKGCSVIFADEATASVDEENKILIMNIFSKLADNGAIILFVTHDKTLKKYFNRVIYLKDNNNENSKINI